MIPYFEQPSLSLGPITIHSFGVLVAVGILSGMYLIRRRPRRRRRHSAPSRSLGHGPDHG